MFPLVQLPKKFKASWSEAPASPQQVSISSTSEEVQSNGCLPFEQGAVFPLVQLPKKFKVLKDVVNISTQKCFH